MEIRFTIIEILTFNKWSSEVDHFQKCAFLLTFHGDNSDVSIDAIVALAKQQQLECGPMPNAMAALPNIGGALCSTPQSLADAHYQSAVQ